MTAAIAIGLREIVLFGLLGLACTSTDIGPLLAAKLLGSVAADREELQAHVDATEVRMQAEAESALRVSLGEQTWRATYAEGRSLGLEEAVSQAIAL